MDTVPLALVHPHVVMLVLNVAECVSVLVYVMLAGVGSDASPGACAGDGAVTTSTRVG